MTSWLKHSILPSLIRRHLKNFPIIALSVDPDIKQELTWNHYSISEDLRMIMIRPSASLAWKNTSEEKASGREVCRHRIPTKVDCRQSECFL